MSQEQPLTFDQVRDRFVDYLAQAIGWANTDWHPDTGPSGDAKATFAEARRLADAALDAIIPGVPIPLQPGRSSHPSRRDGREG
jgi:hypothetical protein